MGQSEVYSGRVEQYLIPSQGDGGRVRGALCAGVHGVFEEQDTSLINQEEGLNDFIRRNAWVIFDTYSERQSSFKKREKKRVESVKDRIAKLEKRKRTAEDKWLDGEWDQDRYHAALERFEAELLELPRELNGLEQASQTEQAVPRNIAQYARLERLDRQLALMLIKRIEVQEDGQVEINYNFTL